MHSTLHVSEAHVLVKAADNSSNLCPAEPVLRAVFLLNITQAYLGATSCQADSVQPILKLVRNVQQR